MSSVSWESFLDSAAGRTVLAWEQGACSRFLANKHGDRALQIGLGALNPFAASLITHRILLDEIPCPEYGKDDFRVRLVAEDDRLPLENECCDVVVLAHAIDRHPEKLSSIMAEAARVLAPNGLLLTLFFNPMGMWAMREKFFKSRKILPNKAAGVPIRVVKAALAKTGLTLEGGNFGVYAVNATQDGSTVRLPSWIDKAGDRWWPTLSNVIVLSARKVDVKANLVGKVNFSATKSAKPASAAINNSKTVKISNDAADCS